MDNGEIMKRSISLLLATLFFFAVALGQTDGVIKKDLSASEIDRIIKKVAENEGDFRAALTSYVFNRFATVNIIGLGGQIAGTYRRDSFMTFSQDGGRFERILFGSFSGLMPDVVSLPTTTGVTDLSVIGSTVEVTGGV